MTEIRTRFAPSPTGFLHIGGARTALFAWLYARRHQGKFILRIEDTDSARSTEASVKTILDGLAWLGLGYDEGPFYQLDNLPQHQAAAAQLLHEGKAYHCYCTEQELAAMREEQISRNEKPRYDRRCRDRVEPRSGVKPTLRFKTPTDGSIAFNDAVHGSIEVQNDELDDLILIRSDGTPTYNLSVVIDDMSAGITHVLRGDDHLNNTPRQIHLLQALNAETPVYAHLPMILDHAGKRLSKRAGAASVTAYRDAGYLPEAVLNYLLRLGWSHGDQEIFSVTEMIDLFDLEHVGKAAASLNPEKLDWLNQHYMRSGDPARISALLADHLKQVGCTPGDREVEKVFGALCGRYKNLQDMAQGAAALYADVRYEPAVAADKLKSDIKPALILLRDKAATLTDWNAAVLKPLIDDTVSESGLTLKQFGPALRFALTGGTSSPALPLTMELIGPERSIQRIRQAIEFIG